MKSLSELPPALQRIAALRDAGHSLRAMADILTSESVPPIGRAKGWNRSRVQDALQQLEAGEAEAEGPTEGAAAPVPEAKPKAASPTAAAPPQKPPAQGDIKIQGPCTRSDGLLWEFLLHEVWDDLGEPDPPHTLPISNAVRGLRGHPPRQDRAALCAALDRLGRSGVVLTGVKGDRRVNVTTALISFAAGTETVTFQFPAALLKLVKNSDQYLDLKELLAAKS